MSALFDSLRSTLTEQVDGLFGERLLILPSAQENQYGVRKADPDRQSFEVIGILRLGRSTTDLSGPGQEAWGTELSSGKAEARIDPASYPEILNIRKSDRIQALERTGAPSFIVERADPHDRTRLDILLTKAG